MGPTPDPPPPDKILTAERMADLADRLQEAIAAIESWNIVIRPESRLRATEAILRDVGAAGVFPESHESLVRAARAARDAREFIEITGMLPETPMPSIAEALKIATMDEMSRISPRSSQFQGELWTGAMLSFATDFVGSPLRAGRPDYIVANGNLEYGVEVKRPQTEGKVLKRAAKAVKQLRLRTPNYHGGALVMDLTDCLDPAIATTLDSGPPILRTAQEWIGRQMRRLHRSIYDDSRKRIRIDRKHIFSVTVVARVMHWDLDDLSQMYLTPFFGCLTYSKSPNSLRGIRASWLAELIPQGARAAGYYDLGRQTINFKHPAS